MSDELKTQSIDKISAGVEELKQVDIQIKANEETMHKLLLEIKELEKRKQPLIDFIHNYSNKLKQESTPNQEQEIIEPIQKKKFFSFR